jgi:hypothetical protein
MRKFAPFILLVAMICGPMTALRAQSVVSVADALAIRNVIERQLDAFGRDDGEGAFAYASPKIRSIFSTADNFMQMVRTGYQPVYRPQSVTFLDIVEIRGQPTQRVLLVGPDGRSVIAHYFMARQPDGSWLIDGCVLSEPDNAAV